jgi:hypothetical protein
MSVLSSPRSTSFQASSCACKKLKYSYSAPSRTSHRFAAAGHDCYVIPIGPENIDAWLSPDPAHLAAQYAILDDRNRPDVAHRLAPEWKHSPQDARLDKSLFVATQMPLFSDL